MKRQTVKLPASIYIVLSAALVSNVVVTFIMLKYFM